MEKEKKKREKMCRGGEGLEGRCVGGKKSWREERRESRKMERMEKEREQSEEKEEEYSNSVKVPK